MESIRQEVFTLMDTKPEVKNKELYKTFPNHKQDTLRRYKAQYFEQLKKVEDLSLSYGQLVDSKYNTILNLINRNGESKNNDSTVHLLLYPKVSEKKKNKLKHLIPLLKTFKLLSLFILKKFHDLSKLCLHDDYSIVELLSILIDDINTGNYNIEELSDFSFKPNVELKGFLDDVSWKRSCINTINDWLKIPQYNHRFFRDQQAKSDMKKEYPKVKAKLIISFLPEFYGIYLYNRKKEHIIRDFSKAYFLNNITENNPISLTSLIDKFNDDLDLRERPSRYNINFCYDESQEFLKE